MGICYDFQYFDKSGKEIEDTPSSVFLSSRWDIKSGFFDALFIKYIQEIEKLAKQTLDLKFYYNMDYSAYNDEDNSGLFFEPKKIKETIKIMLTTLRQNQTRLPYFYWIEFDKSFLKKIDEGEYINPELLFIENKKVKIHDGWDMCYYRLNHTTVDLRQKSKILGNRVFSSYNIFWKWIRFFFGDYIAGTFCRKDVKDKEEGIVIIKKESIYRYYREVLEKIVDICNYAIKHNYYIKMYAW